MAMPKCSLTASQYYFTNVLRTFVFVATNVLYLICVPCFAVAEDLETHHTVLPSKNVTPTAEKGGEELWRVRNRCGVNSVYVLARLLGKTVRYDDVLAAIPINESGSTMADMRNYLQSLGMSPEVIMANPELLKECPLPAIARLETDSEDSGHFVVLVAFSPTNVRIINGITGVVETMSSLRFQQRWTGHLLVNRPQNSYLRWFYCCAIVLGAITMVQVSWRTLHRKHRRISGVVES